MTILGYEHAVEPQISLATSSQRSSRFQIVLLRLPRSPIRSLDIEMFSRYVEKYVCEQDNTSVISCKSSGGKRRGVSDVVWWDVAGKRHGSTKTSRPNIKLVELRELQHELV